MRDQANRDVRLGIGVATYKRPDKLRRCLASLKALTSTPFEFVVADDGSGDNTADIAAEYNAVLITGQNRGVAWNKNRALFYLHALKKCDVVIIFEDDTYVINYAWEGPWIDFTLRHGHMNFAATETYNTIVRGDGSLNNPHQAFAVGGMVSSYSAGALRSVGYVDPRFRRYGYEHVEHTDRLVRVGYGGVEPRSAEDARHFFVLKSPIGYEIEASHGSSDGLEENRRLFLLIQGEPVYRLPWHTQEDYDALLIEVQEMQRRERAKRSRLHGLLASLRSTPNLLSRPPLVWT